jgi:hypothetical protein
VDQTYQASSWAIPGVGVACAHFDRVCIASANTVGALKALLPIPELKQLTHKLDIITLSTPDPRLQSTIVLVEADGASPWQLLQCHEQTLANYRATRAEIACDVNVSSIAAAYVAMHALVGLLDKPRHQRSHLRLAYKPDEMPPPGCVSELPTIYYEHPSSSIALKCYARYHKLACGQFGGLCVRLEWTLKGKRSLERYLGGNQIKDLATADLGEFCRQNMRLVRVDHAMLGKLLGGEPVPAKLSRMAQWTDPGYLARRAAHLNLRLLADREYENGKLPDREWALWICQNSPAQIRGYCNELRDKERKTGRGRPRARPLLGRPSITDYRIKACFVPVSWVAVDNPICK